MRVGGLSKITLKGGGTGKRGGRAKGGGGKLGQGVGALKRGDEPPYDLCITPCYGIYFSFIYTSD